MRRDFIFFGFIIPCLSIFDIVYGFFYFQKFYLDMILINFVMFLTCITYFRQQNYIKKIEEENEIIPKEKEENEIISKEKEEIDEPIEKLSDDTSSNHNGTIYMYYKAETENMNIKIKGLYESQHSKELETRNFLKLLFRLKKNTVDIFDIMCKEAESLKKIEEIRQNNSELSFGDKKEFDSHSLQINKLYNIRVLYVFTWDFKLELENNWRNALSMYKINIFNYIKKNKAETYRNYLIKYEKFVDKCLDFRNKHYLYLMKNETSCNELNAEFLDEILILFKNLMGLISIHNDFFKELNFFERKKYEKFKLILIKFPKISIAPNIKQRMKYYY
jgi:hypothetical protein